MRTDLATLFSTKKRQVRGDRFSTITEFETTVGMTKRQTKDTGNNCLAFALGATTDEEAIALRCEIHSKLLVGLEETDNGTEWR